MVITGSFAAFQEYAGSFKAPGVFYTNSGSGFPTVGRTAVAEAGAVVWVLSPEPLIADLVSEYPNAEQVVSIAN